MLQFKNVGGVFLRKGNSSEWPCPKLTPLPLLYVPWPLGSVPAERLTETAFPVLCLTPRFDVVGYGCMTCIGNSGPLPEPVVEAITQVMSGTRVLRPLVWVSITLGRFWKL